MTYLSSSSECPKCGGNHKGKPFCAYENGYHCFSCGYTKTYDRTYSIFEQRKLSIPEFPDNSLLKCKMDDFTLINKLWLNKYYITKDDVIKYNIQEAPNGALIFCAVINGEVAHYQTRLNTTPRYITSKGQKVPAVSFTDSSTIVLVEDFVSHIRVGKYFDAACLWGTKASYTFLESLLSYTKILVWLDNDAQKETNSGQIAAKKICNSLESILSYKNRRYGFGNINLPVVMNMVTDADPKYYSPSELEELLGVKKCDPNLIAV